MDPEIDFEWLSVKNSDSWFDVQGSIVIRLREPVLIWKSNFICEFVIQNEIRQSWKLKRCTSGQPDISKSKSCLRNSTLLKTIPKSLPFESFFCFAGSSPFRSPMVNSLMRPGSTFHTIVPSSDVEMESVLLDPSSGKRMSRNKLYFFESSQDLKGKKILSNLNVDAWMKTESNVQETLYNFVKIVWKALWINVTTKFACCSGRRMLESFSCACKLHGVLGGHLPSEMKSGNRYTGVGTDSWSKRSKTEDTV